MPERIVRPSILTSDRINIVSWPAEVFYRRLMSVVDDYGRFDGRPSILRAALYPLKLNKVSDSDVSKWMSECSEADLVSVYHVDNKPYVQIDRFNQRLRAKVSKYPEPPTVADIRTHPHASADKCNGDGDGDGDEAISDSPTDVGTNIPDCLQKASGFIYEWSQFKLHRRRKRAAMTPHAENLILTTLAERPSEAVALMQLAIASGWQGLKWEWFDNSKKGNRNGNNSSTGGQSRVGSTHDPSGSVASQY